MLKTEKQNIKENIYTIFDTTINLYKNSDARQLVNSIIDTKVSYLSKLEKTFKKSEVMEILENVIKYNSQQQTDLAIHNLRLKGLI